MWRRHGSSFYFFDKGWSSANPSAPPPAPNALFEIWEGYEREVVERKPRERFLFQPKDWEQTSPWHLLSYMQARALDSTNRVDLLASFEREPTKIPSSSKLTKELLIPPWLCGQINNSAYSCFGASSFIRLSSPPGFAGSIYTYGSCVSYKYCTSDRVLCDTICSRLQSNRYDVCAPNQLKVFKTWFFFFFPMRLRHRCIIFLHTSLSTSLFT